MVSVIIPVYNEERYIAKCIESVLLQDYSAEDLEILLIDGMSSDSTRSIILSYIKDHPNIRLIDNPNKIVPCALNIGVKAAKGELIVRLDAHATYPSDYISQLVIWHNKLPEAWNVGGVCDTCVVNSNRVSESIARVMSDKFGVGNSSFRNGTTQELSIVDTVPFGSFKRFVFDKVGFFNEALIRCQDIEFNKRIKREGGTIYLVPSIHCTYIPRDNFKSFSRNRYMTGFWVIKTCFITKTTKNLGLRHFIPALFVMSLLLPVLFGFLWHPLFFLSLFVAIVYLLFMLIRSIQINNKKTSIPLLVLSFMCLHLSYGAGSIIALLSSIGKKGKK